MSEMPPRLPPRPPNRRPPRPGQVHPPTPCSSPPATAVQYTQRQRTSDSGQEPYPQRQQPYTPRQPVQREFYSQRLEIQPTQSSASGMKSVIGSSAFFASKARSAISATAGFVGSAAVAAVAAAAAGSSSERKATWEDWTRDWREQRRAVIKGTETIHILPGWAVKRPRKGDDTGAFDLHVSTLGFCTFVRDPDSISRTQRALMGVAKRFAALPTLPASFVQSATVQRATVNAEPLSYAAAKEDQEYVAEVADRVCDEAPHLSALKKGSTDKAFEDLAQLSLAHEYLDSRLAPFWSSVLAFRRVALSIYTVPLDGEKPVLDDTLWSQEPLMRTTFTTNAQGHFSHNISIPWERLCTHPPSVSMAFEQSTTPQMGSVPRFGLAIRAELLHDDMPVSSESGCETATLDTAGDTGDATSLGDRRSTLPDDDTVSISSQSAHTSTPQKTDTSETKATRRGLGKTSTSATTVVQISSPGGIRIISDLDDTVKHSDILSGAREVFRNVFCRRVDDILVPGMNQLYENLTKVGVAGIHFVSNSPFELFPVVTDFLQVHKFPSYYSLKLKFYGGRSIVTSLFEPAGQRKRPSIIEIMDEFSDSKFLLIGDSGEQDLELYTAIAHERPHQVAAILIRDVTSERFGELRSQDPTSKMSQLVLRDGPLPYSNTPSTRSGASTPTTQQSSQSSSAEELNKTMAELQELTAAQKQLLRRAANWDMRVQRAYDIVPDSVPLVFFKEGSEIESLAKEVVFDAQRNVANRGEQPSEVPGNGPVAATA